MMKQITLDISQLNELGFNYLQAILPDYEGEDFESLYASLTYLEDIEFLVENYDQLDDFSSAIIRLINEVADDYGNISLSFSENESNKERKKIVMDIHELDKRGHEYLKELFDFPDYYGENLNALYDCLCEQDDTEVIIMNSNDLSKFSLKVLDVFDEVADEFGNLKISYEFDEEE